MSPLEGFGFEVRSQREGRKLTQKHVAKAIGYSEAYVSRVESGKLMPSEKFARGCDLVFGTHGIFERLRRRIAEGEHPTWFVPYLQLEPRAVGIRDFSAQLIMGLVQTEAYAEAIFRAAHPRAESEVIDGKVAARLRRQDIFAASEPPALWLIVHEMCLRTLVGGRAVMAGQLEHLLTYATSPHMDLQVLPFSAGVPDGEMLSFTLLSFDNSPTVVYSGDRRGGRVYDAPKVVRGSVDAYDRLRAHALSPDDSVALVTSLLKEYRS
ncbi:helix-turn-helix domain-containing protein [Streptomyces sp. SBT349]|uniref:helix-turn-helix domain-containing protein n=1 Tax=Streptomyces sp. SBT349 TaxID=1580539 RepID=UPI001F3B6DEA|nr:helix-turn-helix transcriptional regulator [Streptomyces sp. SBT349]